jgi:hypothetical protein
MFGRFGINLWYEAEGSLPRVMFRDNKSRPLATGIGVAIRPG